ncbi:barstar family protein [Pseudomonas sp. KCJK9016]|uniref:barstar family protein n=1 Tax=Pseudomonas sp. KCJK9016 TaxID=3344556 RepID=UPI003906079A
MIITLDGLTISSEQEFHKEIAIAFSVTDFYGNNLNALWDLLSTGVERPIDLIWKNSELSKKNMGDSYNKIIKIFERTKQQDVGFGWEDKFNYYLE